METDKYSYLDQLHARIELLEAQLQSQSARDRAPDISSNSVQLEHQEIPSPSRGSSEGPSGLDGHRKTPSVRINLNTL